MTTPCQLSVVIPAYNEARAIRQALGSTARYLAGLPLSWEIVVVNDGSQDTTAAEVSATIGTLAQGRIRMVSHVRNLGKGAAVRTGVLASAGQWILFCDADGSTPIEAFGKFLPHLQDGADLVAGSRRILGAEIRRHQDWLRQVLGRCYTRLTNLLITHRASDITCGFKALRRQAAQAIFSRARVTGWSFDAEMFFLARRLGLHVVEVPVTWSDRPNTRVRLGRAVITSFGELLRIRWYALTGRYR